VANLKDLETAIDLLLNHPLGLRQYRLARRAGDTAYEAYVFGLCIRAARELGSTVVLHGINGAPNPFIFRGAPGQIHGNGKNYGYAKFNLNNNFFEIHVDIEFKGTSGMMHEIDVCVIRSEDADECRRKPDDPSAASLVAGWECKFYSKNLNKGLGRAFVGLMDDMGTNVRLSGMCSNAEHPQLKSYFKLQRRPHPHFQLTPLEKSNEDIFVNQLKAALKKMTAS
jgi:hypothetical protein